MNYQEADAKLLTGRCSTRRKLQNNTYLERSESYLRDKTISVRLHQTDIITFHPDGRIDICNGGYPTITTHDRLNTYLPRPYRVYGEPVETRRNGQGMTVLSDGRGGECLVSPTARISANGMIDGKDVSQYRLQRHEEQNAANRVRNRARYWVRKARGIFVDRSKCNGGRRGFRKAGVWNECYTLRASRWRMRPFDLGEYKCGCRVYHKPATYSGTVESILQEENATVRVAKMTCYGIEKFFLDANAKVMDDKAGYQLLSLPFERWNEMKALKMTCPSTGAVYVNAVPPTMNEVSAALDWMFNTENYLETVTQQS